MMTSDEWFVTEEELANWMQQRTRSHPMTTNLKPMLTRAELNQERKALADMDSKFGGTLEVDCYVRKQTAMLNTIAVMAELLERWQKSQTPTTKMLISRQELEALWFETTNALSTFNATGGPGSE